jgi:broad specificity phosphatase PhoE
MECWLVRHGESTWNSVGRFQGGLDNAIWTLRLDNASITRVVLPAGRLLGWNETGHLGGVPLETVAP